MLEGLSEGGVERGVLGRRVETATELVAVREANGVGSRESDHVGLGEAVLGEHGVELVQIEVCFWEVSGYS